jgi:hypothetical protein
MPVTHTNHNAHVYMCVCVHARARLFKIQHTTAADKYYATRQGLLCKTSFRF